jgi:hypothetical protein
VLKLWQSVLEFMNAPFAVGSSKIAFMIAQLRRVITPADRDAVLAARQAYLTHGSILIAQALKATFSFAKRNSVQRVLRLVETHSLNPKNRSGQFRWGDIECRWTFSSCRL